MSNFHFGSKCTEMREQPISKTFDIFSVSLLLFLHSCIIVLVILRLVKNSKFKIVLVSRICQRPLVAGSLACVQAAPKAAPASQTHDGQEKNQAEFMSLVVMTTRLIT